MLSRRSLLAVSAMLDVALHARPTPVAGRALAERLSLPPRHLETLLQSLVRGGLLKGTRGPHGGYALARDRRRISVGDIVRAIGQPNGDGGPLPATTVEIVLPALSKAQGALLSELDRVTLEELCRSAGKAASDVEFHDVGL